MSTTFTAVNIALVVVSSSAIGFGSYRLGRRRGDHTGDQRGYRRGIRVGAAEERARASSARVRKFHERKAETLALIDQTIVEIDAEGAVR